MTPTFPGILGREFARVDKTARALCPGSAPGIRVSRTTQGALLKPIRQRLPAGMKIAQFYVFAIYDDVVQGWDYDGREYWIAKPPTLRTAPWRGTEFNAGTSFSPSPQWTDSWWPGKPFRWGLLYQPTVELSSPHSFDFIYHGDSTRMQVWDRPSPDGSLPYTTDLQIVWPEYKRYPKDNTGAWFPEYIPITAVFLKEGVWDHRLGNPFIFTAEYLAATGLPAEEGTRVQWLDLNMDARAWHSVGLLTSTAQAVVQPGDVYRHGPFPVMQTIQGDL